MRFQLLSQILGLGVAAAVLGACGGDETGATADGPGGGSQAGGADNAGGATGATGGLGGGGGVGAAGGESAGGSGNRGATGGTGGAAMGGTGGVGGGPCVPTSCSAEGAECGNISDGCGDTLFCGTCAGFETCGGAGEANLCGCAPTTCLAQGADCGVIPDGCGFSINCGGCVGFETCGGGGTTNVCGCTPTTCAALGKDCGTVPDGCGGSLSCGSCSSPLSCAGGGVANVCGCVMVATATAPASAVTGESLTEAGFEDWTSPSSLQFADSVDGGTNAGTRAWARLTGSVPISEKLVARNFGFALPDEAVILGIQVQIRRKQRDKFLASWNMFDNAIHLVMGGVNASTNKAVATDWPTLFTNATYGGPGDVWGGSWTAGEINDPSFGVGIRAQWTGQAGNNDAEVDHVQMTITYQACQ